jgi:hypothetical protein
MRAAAREAARRPEERVTVTFEEPTGSWRIGS